MRDGTRVGQRRLPLLPDGLSWPRSIWVDWRPSRKLAGRENLELDPDFGALERAAQGKPETQYGNTIEPAIPPDWKETATLAVGLLQPHARPAGDGPSGDRAAAP